MEKLRVDWNLLSPARIPEWIRATVERHLAVLWQFLDCSQIRDLLPWNGPCRSEEFEMNLGQWSFTYEIDLSSGTAVVRHARADA
jgi:hypothetical protein